MSVQEISAGQGWAHGAQHRVKEAGTPWMDPEQVRETRSGSGDDGSKGVVRLLMEGHFQGVADVRLRINFMEELRQVADAEAADTLKNEMGALAGRVRETTSTTLAELLDNGLLSDTEVNALTDQFEQTAAEIMAGMDESGAADALQRLRDALDTLETSLADALGYSGELQVEDTVDGSTTVTSEAVGEDADAGPAESGAEILPSLADGALEQLHVKFMELLQNVEASVADSGSLAPLSEPHGNGRAYSKFLSTYTEMTQGAVAAEAPADNLDILI